MSRVVGAVIVVLSSATVLCTSCGLPNMMAAPTRHKLFRAAEHGDVQEVEHLLESGLDPDTSGFYSNRALRIAAHSGQCDVLDVLLKHGARTDDHIAELALREAIDGSHRCAVTLLVDHGVSPNANFYLGGTPLMKAVKTGDQEMVNALLQKGADPNQAAHYEGWVEAEPCSTTPLALAAGLGDLVIVQTLMAGGADPSHRDSFNCSASEAAERAGHPEIADSLKREGR